MGYTHYWDYKPQPGDTLKFKDVLREVLILKKKMPENSETAGGNYSEYPITLRNGAGKGLPTINETEICFNGDGNKGLDHETFIFEFKEEERGDFCKTARKPYDMFVCLCLIALANNFELNLGSFCFIINLSKYFIFIESGLNKLLLNE